MLEFRTTNICGASILCELAQKWWRVQVSCSNIAVVAQGGGEGERQMKVSTIITGTKGF